MGPPSLQQLGIRLGLAGTKLNRGKQPQINSGRLLQVLQIHSVILALVSLNQSQFPGIGHDHLVSQPLEQTIHRAPVGFDLHSDSSSGRPLNLFCGVVF